MKFFTVKPLPAFNISEVDIRILWDHTCVKNKLLFPKNILNEIQRKKIENLTFLG